MDWVHCNSCFCQPAVSNKELVFSLTSCGHILCNKCTANRDKYCLVCQSSCNLVCLSKQVPQEVVMYFTSPCSLLDKFITQFERVVQFQNTQRARLLKYKLHQIQIKTKEKETDIARLEKENALLKMKINQMKIVSPMNVTPSPPIPVHTPVTVHSVATHTFLHTPQSASPSSSISGRPLSTGPSLSITPAIRKRPLNSTEDLRSVSPSPSSQCSMASSSATTAKKQTPNSAQRNVTSAVGSSRLCIRTPPIDGKIGVVPGITNTPSHGNKTSICTPTSNANTPNLSSTLNRKSIGSSRSPYLYPAFGKQTSLSKPNHPCLPPYTPSPSLRVTSIPRPYSGHQISSSLISRIKQ